MILGRFILVLGLSLLLVLPAHAIKQRSLQLSESDMELGNDMDTEMELDNEENQGQSIQSDELNEAQVGEMDDDEESELAEDNENRKVKKYVWRYRPSFKCTRTTSRWLTRCNQHGKSTEARLKYSKAITKSQHLALDVIFGMHYIQGTSLIHTEPKKIQGHNWGNLRCYRQKQIYPICVTSLDPVRASYEAIF